MPLYPYLFFPNTTRDAMTRYHEILGGRLDIMSPADVPDGELPDDAPPDFVIHASLEFGDGDLLMASDDPSGDGGGMKGAALSLSFAELDDVRRVFEALADGGTVQMPLGQTFWSPLFGACVDRFGVSWMVGADSESPQT